VRQSICICASIIALACAHGVSAATIDVFEMGITTLVLMDGGQDFESNLAVINPFATTQHAQLGLTEATTIIDLAWGPAGGRFDFLFDQVIDDTDEYAASTTIGQVNITSDIDLMLNYEYTYSYNHLTGDIAVQGIAMIFHFTDDGVTLLKYDVQVGGAGLLRPTSGTFSSTTQVLLEAGERYGIGYSTELSAGEERGAVGSGAGSLHFTLTPVPEPTTALLLALSAIALFHRVARPFRGGGHDDRFARHRKRPSARTTT